jgi:hypothetical protein
MKKKVFVVERIKLIVNGKKERKEMLRRYEERKN